MRVRELEDTSLGYDWNDVVRESVVGQVVAIETSTHTDGKSWTQQFLQGERRTQELLR